jgi:signal transduction histidine kinase/ActR/RegA family two-component response regulator
MRKEIEAKNAKLQQQVAMGEQYEVALRIAHNELEQRVAERTAELARANATLKAEIAERKRAEEEREALLAREKAARSKAEAADRLKDEFLATLSHELRTPLTAIVGWAQLLRTGRMDTAAVQRGCEVIERNSRAELQLVEELLDISAIIGGKMVLKAEPVCLVPVIHSAVECVKLAAEAKGVCISLSRKTTAREIWGESSRLQQAIWNLLSNSIKFTPPGGNVAVSLQEFGSMARIRISDTGEGISAEFLPHMFDRFRQADSSTTRRCGGLGLGLSIVRHLVEMHGGTVRGESAGVGQGATFTIDLPLMPVVEEAALSARAGSRGGGGNPFSPTLAGLHVLVIDDEPDMRELMTCMLTRVGAEVRVAAEAEGGFEIFEQWRPDVIVSDIGLPGEDGYALIRRIRALPVDRGGQTPAAALTAYVGQGACERTLSEGYQVHISKPAEPTELIKVIAGLASRGRHLELV